jgi:hypothetical protein
MKPFLCKTLYGLTVALVIVALFTLGAGVASAQIICTPTNPACDVFRVNFFAHIPVDLPGPIPQPDETVRISNPGLFYGNLCAMIYVFDEDQQLTECCGCVETHNGLRTLSARRDLTKNPLTGVHSKNGVIKIVSAAVNNSPCDPSSNVTPKPNLRAWATHIQNAVGSTFPITETEFTDSTLGATELANLQAQCAFIGILGSGHGICTCGTGD